MPGSLPASKKESQRRFPQVREKGRVARQVLHTIVVERVTGFVPGVFSLERFAEKGGNQMKRSQSEQSFSPLCHHHNQPYQNKGAAEKVRDQALLMWLPTGFAAEAMGEPFS